MLKRGIVAEEIVERAYLSNDIDGQGLVTYGDPPDNMLYHPREFIIHNKLRKTEGHPHLEHSQTVYQIGTCQSW